MKISAFFFALSVFFPTALFAQWQNVGNADYNWGPFHVYSVGLYTENGQYQSDDRPLMFTIRYEKPIEGKSFAISLVKEINNLRPDDGSSEQWLKKMQQIFPDFSPKDVLNYIVLKDKGYFVYNDSVLPHEFDATFNQAFTDIWLSSQSSFAKLQPQLLGKSPTTPPPPPALRLEAVNEDPAMPELPPNYPLWNKTTDQG